MLKKSKRPSAPQGYRDIFDLRDARKGPLILSDCTSVEWPKGWDREDAARYRKANGLELGGSREDRCRCGHLRDNHDNQGLRCCETPNCECGGFVVRGAEDE